jgi:hypothetical protein
VGLKGSTSGTVRHWGIVVALVLAAGAGPSAADVTIERGSSIIVFPKVIFDSGPTYGPVDTIIQITNTSNSIVYAHCYYMNAIPEDPRFPPSEGNPPRWQEINFDIFLTKQQPTHWVVGSGRSRNPTDPICIGDGNMVVNRDCSGAGFDPGLIPLTTDPFVGELRCIEVDSSGAPINGNHLKGEATIVAAASFTAGGAQEEVQRTEISKYNAIGILGLNTDLNSNNSDSVLCLGGGVRPGCPGGAEYNGCPEKVFLNHFAENADNPVALEFGDTSNVTTEVTLVPCTQDLENLVRPRLTVQFTVANEFEELFSASIPVDCWANFFLSDFPFSIFDEGTLGTRFAQTEMFSPVDHPGFIGVAEEYHRSPYNPASLETSPVTRAALNLFGRGERVNGDLITVQGGRGQ